MGKHYEHKHIDYASQPIQINGVYNIMHPLINPYYMAYRKACGNRALSDLERFIFDKKMMGLEMDGYFDEKK